MVDCGALDALVICLEEFDPGVKESAAWALGYIARHNAGQYQTLLVIKQKLQYAIIVMKPSLMHTCMSYFIHLLRMIVFP